MNILLSKDKRGVRAEHETKDDVATLGEIATHFSVQSRSALMEEEEEGDSVPCEVVDLDEASVSSSE